MWDWLHDTMNKVDLWFALISTNLMDDLCFWWNRQYYTFITFMLFFLYVFMRIEVLEKPEGVKIIKISLKECLHLVRVYGVEEI